MRPSIARDTVANNWTCGVACSYTTGPINHSCEMCWTSAHVLGLYFSQSPK